MEGANSETNSNSDQDSGKHSDTSLVNSSEECWAEIDKINKSIDKRETDKLSKGVDKSKDKRDLDYLLYHFVTPLFVCTSGKYLHSF